MRCHQYQSWPIPSQMRRALPIPFAHSRPESRSAVGRTYSSLPTARMISIRRTDAGPGDRKKRLGVVVPDEGEQLPAQIAVVFHLSLGPVPHEHALRKPALAIDAVRAVQMETAMLEVVTQGGDHAVVLRVEEPSLAGRKGEQRHGGVAEDEELNVALQMGTVPAPVFTLHWGGPRSQHKNTKRLSADERWPDRRRFPELGR